MHSYVCYSMYRRSFVCWVCHNAFLPQSLGINPRQLGPSSAVHSYREPKQQDPFCNARYRVYAPLGKCVRHVLQVFMMEKEVTSVLRCTCISSSVASPPSRTTNPFSRRNGSKGDDSMRSRSAPLPVCTRKRCVALGGYPAVDKNDTRSHYDHIAPNNRPNGLSLSHREPRTGGLTRGTLLQAGWR